MKPIRLEDLRGEPAEFYIKKTDKTYHLRPVSMDDERWMAQTFGKELEAVFKEFRMHEICRIAFRLMDEEERRDFAVREEDVTDENGVTSKRKIGGVELLESQIIGVPEKIVLVKALLQTIGFSRPVLDQLERDEAEAEKKRQAQTKPTGERSSTSSPRSTAGRSTKSGGSPRARSSSSSSASRQEGRVT